jgi:PTS system nitrogen regulatory IIA component
VKLTDVLKQKAVISDLQAQNRDDLLKEMVEALIPEADQEKEGLIQILKEREDQCPTAIKDGIAIPHGRVTGLEGIFMGFGRSRTGVSFGAPDGKPTHLFFLIFAPQNSAGEHLKVLARIARLCKNSSLRERLLRAESREEIYKILMEGDAKL